jgi:hypothetical protein
LCTKTPASGVEITVAADRESGQDRLSQKIKRGLRD